MKKIKLLLLVSFIAAASCKKDKSSPFVGSWAGDYSGSDQGSWQIQVSDNGIMTGSGNSTRTGQGFTLTGNVSDNGAFKATSGVAGTGSEFTGTLTKNGKASGTWKNTAFTPPLEGSWQGDRK
ncbi:hypothetical protein [Parapedobacter soli]|uniref:hypothetical protein n=1 Tax=Parapedobacter soli TaxID=416955 RepID=UPI0021CA9323|nr:hypothetical protein [Parapedobacter soli]